MLTSYTARDNWTQTSVTLEFQIGNETWNDCCFLHYPHEVGSHLGLGNETLIWTDVGHFLNQDFHEVTGTQTSDDACLGNWNGTWTWMETETETQTWNVTWSSDACSCYNAVNESASVSNSAYEVSSFSFEVSDSCSYSDYTSCS